MSPSLNIKEKSIDSALFLSPPNNWEDTVVAMKPGAHLLLFNNVRDHHLGTIAAEDSELEIRDTLAYVFADGENDVGMQLIAMARKPLGGTVAENTLRWGTGGINIEGCRVELKDGDNKSARYGHEGKRSTAKILSATPLMHSTPDGKGRWPANLLHCGSPGVTALFPDSKTSRIEKPCLNPEITGHKWGSLQVNRGPRGYDGDGSAARFFHSAPTLNSLLKYLLKLITPPNGTVLTLPQDFDIVTITDGLTGNLFMQFDGGRLTSEDPRPARAFRNEYGG